MGIVYVYGLSVNSKIFFIILLLENKYNIFIIIVSINVLMVFVIVLFKNNVTIAEGSIDENIFLRGSNMPTPI